MFNLVTEGVSSLSSLYEIEKEKNGIQLSLFNNILFLNHIKDS